MSSSSMALSATAARTQPLWRPALGLAVLGLLIFGLAYTLLATALGALLFPQQANGSLLRVGERVVASEWVAQPFTAPGYFHSRPSAAGYDPMAAAGSNQARSNPDLQARLNSTAEQTAAREGVSVSALPSDLITQSGSGLDPHISPRAADVQAARVAKARGLDLQTVELLIKRHTEAPQFGWLGQPRINVARLNLALDALGEPAVHPAQAQ